jgi:hypothetical protein
MEISPIMKCIGIAALTTYVISGCATITTGTDQGIKVITEKDVIGASCTLMDSKGNRSFIPRTPGTTYMTRGNAPLVITCTKPGYKSTTLEIDESVAGATMGNIILGGGIGIIFDASSGAAQRYPDKVVIWMEPVEWPDENSKLQWEKERRLYIEESISAARDSTLSDSEDEFE